MRKAFKRVKEGIDVREHKNLGYPRPAKIIGLDAWRCVEHTYEQCRGLLILNKNRDKGETDGEVMSDESAKDKRRQLLQRDGREVSQILEGSHEASDASSEVSLGRNSSGIWVAAGTLSTETLPRGYTGTGRGPVARAGPEWRALFQTQVVKSKAS